MDFLTKIILIAVVYILVAVTGFLVAKKWLREKRSTFFKAVYNAYKEGTLNENEDLVNIYKGINGEGEESEIIAGINKYLRLFLIEIRTYTGAYRFDEKTNIQTLVNFINSVIRANEANQPFSDVPALERNILKDTTKFISLGEKGSAVEKLIDLGALIQARQDSLEKVQKANKWAVPLAVVGLILTIIFGTMSIWQK